MNSKRKDLQYASVFLLAVALTFLMGNKSVSQVFNSRFFVLTIVFSLL